MTTPTPKARTSVVRHLRSHAEHQKYLATRHEGCTDVGCPEAYLNVAELVHRLANAVEGGTFDLMTGPDVTAMLTAARNRLFKAEFAVRNAGIRYSDVDPLAVELFRAQGALDAIEDVWQAQVAADDQASGVRLAPKLVRDKIPDIIRAHGGEPAVRTATAAEFRQALRNKLAEETREVLEAGDGDVVEELADVLEVVRALAEDAGVAFERLEQVRVQKAVDRGGFTRRVIWEGNTS